MLILAVALICKNNTWFGTTDLQNIEPVEIDYLKSQLVPEK